VKEFEAILDLKNTEKPKMKKVVVQEESSEGSDVEFNDSKKSNKNEEKDSKSNQAPRPHANTVLLEW